MWENTTPSYWRPVGDVTVSSVTCGIQRPSPPALLGVRSLSSDSGYPLLPPPLPKRERNQVYFDGGFFLSFCLLLTELKTQAIWPPTEGTVLPCSFQKSYVTVSHEAQQRAKEPMEAHLLPCRSHSGRPPEGVVAHMFPWSHFTHCFNT